MNFVHPWLLLVAVVPVLWVVREWPVSARRLSLALKGAAFFAIALAFAQPTAVMPETKTGAIVLVDTSASIPDAGLDRESSLVSSIASHRGTNWMRIVPFARRPRELEHAELSGQLHLAHSPGDDAQATNIEAALRDSMAAIPVGRIPRLVLISDGNENDGSSARAIAQLQRLSVPVDTIALEGRPRSDMHLVSVSMPREGYTGEQIPIDLMVETPTKLEASVRIQAEGKDLGSYPVTLEAGANPVRIHARINASGVTSVTGILSSGSAAGSGSGSGAQVQFDEAIQLRRAKVLFLSEDPPVADQNLLQALDQAQFDVARDRALIDKNLDDIQVVVLNNLDLHSFSPAQKSHLEEYVKRGGGLLLIGGERQVYKEDKQMDALDEALPAKLAPPKSPEGTAVALIIDKSSSMEGRKIELARLSAIGVVEHLRPLDLIGVLIFDNSFQWAVPMRRAEDKSLIKRLISGITPDGGTQIAPALTEAYRKVLAAKSTYKHIVLLTDGISEEGDSFELAHEAMQHDVTISTVGLGQDVNRAFLEKVASTAGGRSYFLNEPQGLEQILLKDVLEYTGSTAVEKPLRPIVKVKEEILEGTGIEDAPPLKGYARFEAKPSAETLLSIDPDKKDPLFVRWQYGLGRAAVFTSDAKSRWAEAWMAWPGFDHFWINVLRDLLPHSSAAEASAQYEPATGDLVVDYRLGAGAAVPTTLPQVYVLGPNGFRKPIEIGMVAPGLYRGRAQIGQLRGLFRIRPLIESRLFPEIGLYRQQEELLEYGANRVLLARISKLTGGRVNPPLNKIFDTGGRTLTTTWQLWPALLALAILLTLAELTARKWAGVRLALHGGKQAFNARLSAVSSAGAANN
jgi:Ca-activated chloride channel family protein